MKHKKFLPHGFTIIELLIVMSIIVLLATLTTVMFHDAQQRTRDAKRLADLRQLATALQLYYQEFSSFPVNPHLGTTCYYAGNGASVTDDCLKELETSGVMPVRPAPPSVSLQDTSYSYGYYDYTAYDPDIPAAVVGTRLERQPEDVPPSCDFGTGTWCNGELDASDPPDSGQTPNRYCICIYY